MSKIIKARVLKGRYTDQIVRVTNVSIDELGRKSAACFLPDGSRANIAAEDLEVIPEEKVPEIKKPKTVSMPFISGSTGSRTMTQTKNMERPRQEIKSQIAPRKQTIVNCEKCGQPYNQEERKGQPGKITECENCAVETEEMMEGKMIFSHKTGATIEIKKDGELRHEAPIYDPKNKS